MSDVQHLGLPTSVNDSNNRRIGQRASRQAVYARVSLDMRVTLGTRNLLIGRSRSPSGVGAVR